MTRTPPALASLDAHGKICKRCQAAMQTYLPPKYLCSNGRVLFQCAKREQARFRRVAS